MSYIACMCYASTLLTLLYSFYGTQAYCKNMSVRLEFSFCGCFKCISHSLTLPFKSTGSAKQCLFIFFCVSSFLFCVRVRAEEVLRCILKHTISLHALLATRTMSFKMFFSCENLISELTAHPATYIFDQN